MAGIGGTVVTAVGAVGGLGGVTAILTYRLKRRETQRTADKTMAEAAHLLTETSLALLKPVQDAAAKAEKKVETLLGKIAELEAAVALLKASQDDLLRQLVEVTAERDAARAQLAAAGPGAAVA